MPYNIVAAAKINMLYCEGEFMSFHKVFRENRKRLGLTQEDVANYLNVTPQAVSKWETGQGTPDLTLVIPIAQLFDITTDELLGNKKDELLIQEELNEIRSAEKDLINKYKSYTKLLKQSPSNVKIIKSCLNCAYSLLAARNKYSLDAEKIEELLSDMERYRKMLAASYVGAYNEMATGKLAEAYIGCGKYENAKDIIKDSTICQWYNQDRLNGRLYYEQGEYQKARAHYAMSLGSSFNWLIRDIMSIGHTYADFRGQNTEKYRPDEFIKVYKYVYDLIKVMYGNNFWAFGKWYLHACEFLAQGYTDIGEYDIALDYLSEFVEGCEEWKKRAGTKPDMKECCFLLSDVPEEMLLPIPNVQKNLIETVFKRNKYTRYSTDARFTALTLRAEKLLDE